MTTSYIYVYYYKQEEASDGERSVHSTEGATRKIVFFLYLNYCGEGGDIFE